MPDKNNYEAADNFNLDGQSTFKKLKPETQKFIQGLIANQTKIEKKTIASDCIEKDKSPPKLLEQTDLQVKLIVVDEKICFVMNKPVDWLGFDREAAEKIGKQLIALARVRVK